MNSIANILYIPYSILFIPLYHCILELLHLIGENLKPIVTLLVGLVSAFFLASELGHYELLLWCLRWIILGVLSSIGFGFGMHTFVLFLAPHIAAVAMAAHSCKSLNFPQPPYPHDIKCPDQIMDEQVTFFNILQKISLEAFMWGLGTAIGELPPYLTARLRAQAIDNTAGAGDDPNNSEPPTVAKWELVMIRIINKIGFVGILLCAAIPNPLFDAAGVASGIAKVPFLTFFGATFIGKAIIKVLLQSSFVVFLFHSNNLDLLISQIDKKLGELSTSLRDLNLYERLSKFLNQQRENVLKKQLGESAQTSLLGNLLNWFICLIMILFMISLINNLDKQYRKRRETKPTRRTE